MKRLLDWPVRLACALAFSLLVVACRDTPLIAPTEPPVAATVSSSSAQPTFVYTNNDRPLTNTVSAFSVGTSGTLTQIAGSPFPTGGSGLGGGFFASNRITASVVAGKFLFASNTVSNNITVFSINTTTGSLTPVPGSPFPTGGLGGVGISLAVTPNTRFLYAGNSGSNDISAFSIASNGALTPVTGSPFSAPSSPDGMKVSLNGKFLSVALPTTPPGAVAMYGIASNGSLTPVPGSPFPDGGAGIATGIDIDCRSSFDFAAEANASQTIVDVFSIASNGALTPIAGSPFNFLSGVNSNVGVLSPDDQFLFVSNQFSSTITVLNVASNGSLTLVPGSPFLNPGIDPSGMATNRAGTLLYVANFNNVITGFSVAGNGALTPVPGSPFPTLQPGGLLSLTVYPGKDCGAGEPTPGKVTGGGQIEGDPLVSPLGELLSLPAIMPSASLTSGAQANFGFVVEDGGNPRGNLVYDDHDAGVRIKATSFTFLNIRNGDCGPNTHARFEGTADVNGTSESLAVEVDDCGEPGSSASGTPDTFSIFTDSYQNSGPLISGNIQIHK